ncbi:hypothetical protein [Actinocorallia libanotica]|uniref:hypothetical protein n=1 Tax=Actinocorallia libanotica TaxID=46162 RepID=UPI0031E002BE
MDLIEWGLRAPSPAAVESAALARAQARIAELENEVKILRKAAAAVEQVMPQKSGSALVAELAGEGVPVKQGCLALGASKSIEQRPKLLIVTVLGRGDQPVYQELLYVRLERPTCRHAVTSTPSPRDEKRSVPNIIERSAHGELLFR